MRQILLPEVPEVGTVLVDSDASHHLLHVLRLERGESLGLSDGRGRGGEALLVGVERGRARLEVTSFQLFPPPLERLVLLGLPRPALLEEALTLGTEAGATCFRLLRTRYSPTGTFRRDRLDKLLQAATIQCRRAWLPLLEAPVELPDALFALPPLRFLAAPGAAAAPSVAEAAALAVGAEGGFHPEEVNILLGNGFVPVGLGPYILRNPTAVAVGLGRLFTSPR